MEKKWIKTEKMLEVLKSEPNVEQQYCHYLGGILRSTHWLEYSSKKREIGDSTNWFEYTWYTESVNNRGTVLLLHPKFLP